MPTRLMEGSRVCQSGGTVRLRGSDVVLTPDMDLVDVDVGQNDQPFLVKAF